jgi:hypothetical protein
MRDAENKRLHSGQSQEADRERRLLYSKLMDVLAGMEDMSEDNLRAMSSIVGKFDDVAGGIAEVVRNSKSAGTVTYASLVNMMRAGERPASADITTEALTRLLLKATSSVNNAAATGMQSDLDADADGLLSALRSSEKLTKVFMGSMDDSNRELLRGVERLVRDAGVSNALLRKSWIVDPRSSFGKLLRERVTLAVDNDVLRDSLASAGIHNVHTTSDYMLKQFISGRSSELAGVELAMGGSDSFADMIDRGHSHLQQGVAASSVVRSSTKESLLEAFGGEQAFRGMLHGMTVSGPNGDTSVLDSKADLDVLIDALRMDSDLSVRVLGQQQEAFEALNGKLKLEQQALAQLNAQIVSNNRVSGVLRQALDAEGRKAIAKGLHERVLGERATERYLRNTIAGLRPAAAQIGTFNEASIPDTFLNTFFRGMRGMGQSDSVSTAQENKTFQVLGGRTFADYKKLTDRLYDTIGSITGLSEKSISKVLPIINQAALASGVNMRSAEQLNEYAKQFSKGFSRLRGVLNISEEQYAKLNLELATNAETLEHANGLAPEQRKQYMQQMEQARNNIAIQTQSATIANELVIAQQKAAREPVKERYTNAAKAVALMQTMGVLSQEDQGRYMRLRVLGAQTQADQEFMAATELKANQTINQKRAEAVRRGDEGTVMALDQLSQSLPLSSHNNLLTEGNKAKASGNELTKKDVDASEKAAKGDATVKEATDVYNSVTSLFGGIGSVIGNGAMSAISTVGGLLAYNKLMGGGTRPAAVIGGGGGKAPPLMANKPATGAPVPTGGASGGSIASKGMERFKQMVSPVLERGAGVAEKAGAVGKAMAPSAGKMLGAAGIGLGVYQAATADSEKERNSAIGQTIGSTVGMVLGGILGPIGSVVASVGLGYVGSKVGGMVGGEESGRVERKSEPPMMAGFQFTDGGDLKVYDQSLHNAISELTSRVDALVAKTAVGVGVPQAADGELRVPKPRSTLLTAMRGLSEF